jgi:transposase
MFPQAIMAKPYSYDFRQKVMEAIELDGLKKSEASELFNISRNTINLWFQRKAQTGDVQAKPRQASSKRQKITDWEKFRAFVKEHGDKTQVEMAQLWEGEISDRTISRALQKIRSSRKKNLRVSRA